MKKVAILTNFTGYDPAYSLISVAGNQVKMLKRHGYEPKVIVCESWKEGDAGPYDEAEILRIPNVRVYNEVKIDDTFMEDIDKIKKALDIFLADVDVVLTHDLIYQPSAMKHNVVARAIAGEKPNIRWLHWVHSATPWDLLPGSGDYREILGKKFPHSFIVFPNAYSIPRVAENFGFNEEEVKYVPHPIDVCDFLGFHPLSRKMVEEHDVLPADVIGVYPLRLDRGKQVEWVVRIFAQLSKQWGRNVRLVIFDFHSTGGDKVVYRQELKALAKVRGLTEKEFWFASEFDESLKHASPRQMIRDFMLISNVYIHPSRSETFSLTTQEAALSGNYLVLNFDFTPMRSLWGDQYVTYRKFSSNIDFASGMDGETTTTHRPSDDQYAFDVAGRITYQLANDWSLAMRTKIRQTRNLDFVFNQFLEPLIYYEEELPIAK